MLRTHEGTPPREAKVVQMFTSVDPLAEMTMTPYQYTYQNPIRFIDPTGMAAEDPPPGTAEPYWKDHTGEYFLRVSGDSYAHLINGEYQGEFYIEPIELSLVALNGKSNDQRYAFSNRCIMGCHNAGGQYDGNGFYFGERTNSERFYYSYGSGEGLQHNSFFKSGDTASHTDLFDYLAANRSDKLKDATLMEFLGDIFGILNYNSSSSIKQQKITFKIADSVIYDMSKTPGNMENGYIYKDSTIITINPSDSNRIRLKSYSEASKQGKIILINSKK